jgi:hypothetical protein
MISEYQYSENRKHTPQELISLGLNDENTSSHTLDQFMKVKSANPNLGKGLIWTQDAIQSTASHTPNSSDTIELAGMDVEELQLRDFAQNVMTPSVSIEEVNDDGCLNDEVQVPSNVDDILAVLTQACTKNTNDDIRHITIQNYSQFPQTQGINEKPLKKVKGKKTPQKSCSYTEEENFFCKRKFDVEYDILRESESESLKKLKVQEKPPKRARIAMSQNYKGIVTRGFANLLLQPKDSFDSELYQKLIEVVIKHSRTYFGFEEDDFKKGEDIVDLYNGVLDYVRENIQGKVIKTSKNNHDVDDSKVGNKEMIQKIFHPANGDAIEVSFYKSVLLDMLNFFFESKYYYEWFLNYCDSKGENKLFLFYRCNIEEMKEIFNLRKVKADFHSPAVPDHLKKTFRVNEFIKSIFAINLCHEQFN